MGTFTMRPPSQTITLFMSLQAPQFHKITVLHHFFLSYLITQIQWRGMQRQGDMMPHIRNAAFMHLLDSPLAVLATGGGKSAK